MNHRGYLNRTNFVRGNSSSKIWPKDLKPIRESPNKQTNVKIPRDGRIISIPKFDFIYEVLSILHDPDIMRPENFVEGYDVYTGRSIDGTDFWVDDSIDEDAMFSTPTPRSQNKVIHHLYCGTKFQRARDRFCNREYHMPIPLILFYDEANVDFFGV